jgi:hypothetical protein
LVVRELQERSGTVIRELQERSGTVIDVWGGDHDGATPIRAAASGEAPDGAMPRFRSTPETVDVRAAAAPSGTEF